MRRAGGVYPKGVPETSEKPGAGRQGQVALSHAEAHRLVSQWAACELASVRLHWYPPSAMGYRDYEPPRDPEARQEREVRRMDRDDAEIQRTGWCVLTLKTVHRNTLTRHYRDGGFVGAGARRAALDAFGRRWVVWAEAVDGPLNSI